MVAVFNITNRFILSIISIIVIVLIGYLQWTMGNEISFSILYLIPLCFFTLYKNATRLQVVVNAVFAALVWLIVELNSNKTFSNQLIPYLNSLVRFAGYIIVTFLCYSLKNKHKALLKSNSRLNELNDEKNKIIGIAAHDLRSSFSSIQAISELMTAKETERENLEFLDLINKASTKSLRLLDNLLNVSKIEFSTINLNIQQHDYISFIKSNIRFYQLHANRKNITIALDCTEDDLIVSYDEIHMEQVLTNLVTNAIKYSHANSEIRIKIKKTDWEVLTEIIDYGVGIPENEFGKLFKFFETTSAKPTSGETATGVGLAIAKKIVRSHGGTIGVKSILDKGSVFFFCLPLRLQKHQVVGLHKPSEMGLIK